MRDVICQITSHITTINRKRILTEKMFNIISKLFLRYAGL